MNVSGRSQKTLFGVQLALVLAIAGAVPMLPPAQGSMLIVSLGGQSAGQIARWAVENDARLVGRGPLANSYVVDGNRGALAGAAWSHGALLMTAAFAGCAGGPR